MKQSILLQISANSISGNVILILSADSIKSIFDVGYLPASVYSNYIKSTSHSIGCPETGIMIRSSPAYAFLFSKVYSLQRIPISHIASILHFHINQTAITGFHILLGNQIDFTLFISIILLYDFIPLIPQILCSNFFITGTLGAQVVSLIKRVYLLPPRSIFARNLSIPSTKTRISATTSYNSGGIISPISRRDRVSASLSSR